MRLICTLINVMSRWWRSRAVRSKSWKRLNGGWAGISSGCHLATTILTMTIRCRLLQKHSRTKASTTTGKQKTDSSDMPGVSVFYQDSKGNLFHTYSAYSRGIDILNPAYNYLDLVPKGRDEAELEWPMAWLRYHDKYDE